MNENKLLIGSLSNDLFRVATLTQRGSIDGAKRFFLEAKKWAEHIKSLDEASYIKNIAEKIFNCNSELNIDLAEDLLMYAVLLQNYALHRFDKN